MRNKRKRAELSIEEIIARLDKKWTRAETDNDIAQRAKKGMQALCQSKCDSNSIWHYFYRFPEIFLFPENIETIRKVYEERHLRYDDSQPDKQLDNFDAGILAVSSAAKALYQEHVAQETTTPSVTKSTDEKEPSKVTQSNACLFDDIDITTQTYENEFFDYLKQLPASNFDKGSQEMAQIGAIYENYLIALTEKYYDAGFDSDEISQLIDEQDKRYRPIVDEKRKISEHERRKAEVLGIARAKIKRSAKYHHDPELFGQQPKHDGHKHFPEHSRDL